MHDPQEQKKDRKIQRRVFLKAIAASGGAAALAGCGAAAATEDVGSGAAELSLNLEEPEHQALAAVGGSLVLEANAMDPKGLLLYRSGETEVRAFSRKCTHSGCVLGGFQAGLSVCPCHNSQFGTDGKPVKGPAAESLREYAASLKGSILTIKG
jgi:Rieske Fe-S protein